MGEFFQFVGRFFLGLNIRQYSAIAILACAFFMCALPFDSPLTVISVASIVAGGLLLSSLRTKSKSKPPPGND